MGKSTFSIVHYRKLTHFRRSELFSAVLREAAENNFIFDGDFFLAAETTLASES
jgi:hypothetical protein